MDEELDLVVVGGCGDGLPLALSFAEIDCRVGIYDLDAQKSPGNAIRP